MLIIIVLSVFLCAFILFLKKNAYKQKVIYVYPLIALFLEMSRTLLIRIDDGLPPGFMALTIMAYLYVLINTRFRISDIKGIYGIFCLFIVIAIFFMIQTDYQSDGILNGASRVFRFLFIYAFFFIGYVSYKKLYEIKILNKSTVITATIFIIITIIMALTNYGNPVYRGSIIYGFVQGELHFPALFVVLALLMLYMNRFTPPYSNSNWKLNILIFTMLLLSAVALMRTPWIIIAIGFFAFFFFVAKNSKFTLKYISYTSIAAILILSFVYISGLYDIRSGVFSETYDFESEGRFLEIFVINTYYLTDLKSTLLGTGNMFGPLYGHGYWQYEFRQIHGTYTRIYHGTGILGVSLYFVFLLSILLSFIKLKNAHFAHGPKVHAALKGTGAGIMVGYMFAAISGATTSALYPPLCFLYAGALLGVLKSDKIKPSGEANQR